MDQFIHLRQWRVIVCKKCQYAVLPSEIDTHFQKSPIHALSKKDRVYIANQVAKINRLICDEEQLKSEFVFPPPNNPPIAALKEPMTDGLRCKFVVMGKQCPYVHRQAQEIRKHCREEHKSENIKAQGQPRKEKRVHI